MNIITPPEQSWSTQCFALAGGEHQQSVRGCGAGEGQQGIKPPSVIKHAKSAENEAALN